MSRSAPRPKRAGDDFARYGAPESEEPSAKKPRFDARNPSTLAPDAPEEDAILELDEIGKGGQQTKRSAVNLDGYESDSSTENFDARASARDKAKPPAAGGAGKAQDEEDNDMFADLEEEEFPDGDDDEELNREGKGEKKAVRFLEAEEIEGQVASSKSGGHVSADFTLNDRGKTKARDTEQDSSSESGGDEERDKVGSDVDEELGAGSKKKHAPKLDAFNMNQEGEDGRFDESGNYVRKAVDPDAVHDSWLEGVSKKEMKKAAEAHEQREVERRKKTAEQDSIQLADILSTLISRLERGETVLEALQRLGKAKSKSKSKPRWQKNKRKHVDGDADAMDVDAQREPADDDPVESRRRQEVEILTEAADQLLTRGEAEVYDTEREMLMRQYRNETGEDWKEATRPPGGDDSDARTGDRQWEYRWSDARDGGERHGPYDAATMRAWNDAGYFGEGVEFRRLGDGDWSRSVDFV
ncbi:MAG: GYF domain-containing protein [Terriglobus roseus]|nr:GYF domain-containing protein [Terriglobus roseus]